MRLLKSIKRLY